MRIVDIREVLSPDAPKTHMSRVEAIVGRTLGEVTVEELMDAASSTAPRSGAGSEVAAEQSATPLREVYLDTEEE